MKAFQEAGPLDIAKLQQEILDSWEAIDAFPRSVDFRTEREVVFYDGPPFPTGSPHHGQFVSGNGDSFWPGVKSFLAACTSARRFADALCPTQRPTVKRALPRRLGSRVSRSTHRVPT